MDKTYTQEEFLQIMEKYNSMDRKVIKSNLKDIKAKYEFDNADIVKQFNMKREKVNGWFNISNPIIPIFQDILKVAAHFGFSIEEVIQTEEDKIENNFIYSL